MISVRRRLTLSLLLGFAAVILGGGLLLERSLTAQAETTHAEGVLAKARALAALTEVEDGHVELDYDPTHMAEYERAEGAEYFEIWHEDGRPLFRSPRVEGDLPRSPSVMDGPTYHALELPDGRPGRAVEIAFRPHRAADPGDDDAPATDPSPLPARLVLVAAQGREALDARLASMRWTLLGAAVLCLLLGALLVAWATSAAFRPIEAVARDLAGRDAEALAARPLPHEGAPREIRPLLDQLEGLLERLAVSFDRVERFTGHVAHELRTPVAELRTLAAVGAAWPRDEAAVSAFFADVGDIASRMDRVIAALLLLARCQAGVEVASPEQIHLRDVLEESAARVVPPESAPHVALEVPSDLVVRSDPVKLGIVVDNLLGNAVAYARAGTPIRCRARRDGASFVLEIRNEAEPLAPSDLERLAEPFARPDGAPPSPEHAGLGLALVAALAQPLALTVRFAQDEAGTFVVRLEGPMALRPGRAPPRRRRTAPPPPAPTAAAAAQPEGARR